MIVQANGFGVVKAESDQGSEKHHLGLEAAFGREDGSVAGLW